MPRQYSLTSSLSITSIRRSLWKPPLDTPLAVNQVYADWVFGHEVLGEVLGAVGGAVLAAGAAETDLQVRETAGKEALHVRIDQGIDMVQEAENLSVLLQELDDGRIQTGQLLEPLILPGIMH